MTYEERAVAAEATIELVRQALNDLHDNHIACIVAIDLLVNGKDRIDEYDYKRIKELGLI
jgi:hypothetical protein